MPFRISEALVTSYQVNTTMPTTDPGTLVDSSADPSNEIVVTKVYDMASEQLSRSDDSFDFTSEPTTAEAIQELNDISENINEAGVQYQIAPDIGSLVVDPSNPNTDAAVGASDLLLERWQTDDGSPDTLYFTTEPTASEGRYIGDCESKVYLTTNLLTDPTADINDGGIIIDYTPGLDDKPSLETDYWL